MQTSDLMPVGSEHALGEDQALLRAAALAWVQPHRVNEFAARHKVAVAEVAALLADPERASHVQGEIGRLRRSGDLLREHTLPALEKFAMRIEGMIDDPDLSPAALGKLAETLFKLSGLAEERAATLRRDTDQTHPAVLNFTIIAPDGSHMQTLPGRVIDVEVDDD